MATIPLTQNHPLPKKVISLARCAELVANAALLFAVSILLLLLPYLLFMEAGTGEEIIRQVFLEKGQVLEFTLVHRIIGWLLLSVSHVLGIIGIFYARKLFIGYQKGEVFTLGAVALIKSIGWIVVWLSLGTQIAVFLGSLLFGFWSNPQAVNIRVSFDESDAYAIIFGLLLVVISHVMQEAVRISEENQEIV